MQRPKGRSARVRERIHGAVVELLRDGSGDELTIPAVARQAGVHPATVYRRWGSIPVLLGDVVAAGPARTAPLPDTGSLDGDLAGYAVSVAETLCGPLGVLLLRSAVSNLPGHGPSAVLAERSQQLAAMLERARARGEHAPTVTELLELVVAPLYFHALFGQPADADHARRLANRLLSMVADRS
jgi:AcrR family transcriptional regulator